MSIDNERARTVVTVAAAVLVVSALAAAAASATVPTGDEEAQVPGLQTDDNTTVLEIEPRHERVEVEPGASEELTVNVTNEEQDEAVEIDGTVAEVEDDFPEDWVTVTPDEDEVEPDETIEVGVSVEVPDDADGDRYHALIGFTDDEVTMPTVGTIPVNSFDLSLSVDVEPTVEVESGHERVVSPSGETHESEFEITNDGDEAVPVEPEYDDEDHHVATDGDRFTPFPRDNTEIDAPDSVAPGDTATVTVEAEVPEGFTGTYILPVDLGVEDDARTGDHWRTARIHLDVWDDDAEPETVEFGIDGDDGFEFEVSANEEEGVGTPEIDVALYSPDGDRVDTEADTVVTESSSVSVGEDDRHDSTPEHAVVESIEQPADGNWTAEVETSNVPRFSYEVRKFD